jgi:lipoprotein signal peptidase
MKYFLTPIILIVFFDLYSKNLAFNYLQKKINIFGDFLFLKYTENT